MNTIQQAITPDLSERRSDVANWLHKAARALDKVGIVSRWLNIAGVTALFLMICLTFIDVFLRYGFNRPIKGSYDFTSLMLVLVVFLGIAHTYNDKGHVGIDIIISHLKPKARLVMATILNLLSIGIFVILVWRSYVQFATFLRTGQTASQYLQIPSAPFAAVVVLGCALLLLLIFRDLFDNLAAGIKTNLKGHHWLLMFLIPAVFLFLAILWMKPTLWQIDRATIGIIGVVFSLAFLLSGLPIAFALILTSLLFLAHIQGSGAAFSIVGSELYRVTSTYSYAVIAFFVLMGFVCLFARFGEDLYYAAYKWLGRLPGGMAMGTIGACTAFAAIVGEGLSSTATFTAVALPQMRKFHYNDRLSAGSILGGSTLGPIIPPSTLFIFYSLLTGLSIGKLFIAGIIPGLILAFIFILTIYVWCRISPSIGGTGEHSTWRERLLSSRAGMPILILFILVIGGIYVGIFTPSEGGAIGVAGAFIIGMIMKRFTWRRFSDALLGAGKVIAMAFLILYSAVVFARFAAFCNLSGLVQQSLTSLAVPNTVVLGIILLVFFLLGFVIDIMALILIGVPLVHPVGIALGFDPIWFAVLVTITIGVGVITPPVGINLFALKGMAPDIPMGTIYRGALPFVAGTVIGIAIIFFIPSLVTWLPGLLH